VTRWGFVASSVPAGTQVVKKLLTIGLDAAGGPPRRKR
jgi:hypothetical protein